MTVLEIYLTIMVTVLVATQIIRIVQNTLQLSRQNKLIRTQLAHLEDVTEDDFAMQRRAYRLAVEYFSRKNSDGEV